MIFLLTALLRFSSCTIVKIDTSKIEINTLMKPVILQYYNRGWNSIR